eukprot:TRINITY_DN11667_c0_g1_i1.p3 TRINITY_DN11667_c0_g1~~TRINITY_DN11667_c0_g1_i1.p3  ORF type:complete len:51 (-),score=9.76 TRINITY_DN11667_c0_g1_i1:217-369(-)
MGSSPPHNLPHSHNPTTTLHTHTPQPNTHHPTRTTHTPHTGLKIVKNPPD